jgi:hypothetical protein
MVQYLPEKISVGLVHVAVAGSKIEIFDKELYKTYLDTSAASRPWMIKMSDAYGGNPYQRLVDMARIAQQKGVIKGILLHQGESNTGDKAWPAKVKKIYDDLLADLKLAPNSIPLLAGELVNADQGGRCASMNEIIATLPQTLPRAMVIPSYGLEAVPDKLHFTAEAIRKFGKRYATRMLYSMGVDIEAFPAQSIAAETNAPGMQYPRVDAQGRAIFKIDAPGASNVQLDLAKKYDMVKNEAGLWTVTTEPLQPGFHYYYLLIDGYRFSDPASESFFGIGKMMSGIEIPAPDQAFYTPRDIPHGQVRETITSPRPWVGMSVFLCTHLLATM